MENIIVNLTPHNVNIVLDDGTIVTIERSGMVARCAQTTVQAGQIQYSDSISIPVSISKYGEVVDLPEPDGKHYYIVSRLIMNACQDRSDLLCPNELVRDDDGNIIGCRSLANN